MFFFSNTLNMKSVRGMGKDANGLASPYSF